MLVNLELTIMDSFNNQIDDLFDRWSKNYGDGDNFVKDGVINESKYNKASKKILFITKEPNDPNKEGTDYREWWNEGMQYTFSYRIAEWAYGILNDFPAYDNIWPKSNGKYDDSLALAAIQSIAFMNVKKSGGKGYSLENEINEYIKRDFQFIHEEIDIINPDIILIGMSWTSTVDLLFPGVKWFPSGYATVLGRHKNSKIIDFYHPSSRGGVVAPYCLLQNIVNSKAFKDL